MQVVSRPAVTMPTDTGDLLTPVDAAVVAACLTARGVGNGTLHVRGNAVVVEVGASLLFTRFAGAPTSSTLRDTIVDWFATPTRHPYVFMPLEVPAIPDEWADDVVFDVLVDVYGERARRKCDALCWTRSKVVFKVPARWIVQDAECGQVGISVRGPADAVRRVLGDAEPWVSFTTHAERDAAVRGVVMPILTRAIRDTGSGLCVRHIGHVNQRRDDGLSARPPTGVATLVAGVGDSKAPGPRGVRLLCAA
jgi:hypothetical protein